MALIFTALMITGIILLVLFFILMFSIKVVVVYKDDVLKVKLHYMIIRMTLYPEKKSEKKKKEKKKKEKKPKEDSSKDEKEEKEKGKFEEFEDKVSQLTGLLQSSKQASITLKKHFIIGRIDIDVSVGGEDAHQTAINYSNHITAITGLIGVLSEFFTVRIKNIKTEPNFLSEKSRYYISLYAKIRLIWLIIAGASLLIAFIKLKHPKTRKGGKKNEPAKTA